MKKGIAVTLIILAVGICIALIGFGSGGWHIKGFWVDRGGIHLSNNDLGELIKVDESFKSFSNIEVKADYLEQITVKEGDAFAVKGQNYERYGGLTVELDGNTLVVNAVREKRWNIDFVVDEWLDWDRWKNDTWVEITYPRGTQLRSTELIVNAGSVYTRSLDTDSLRIVNDFGNVDVSGLSCEDMELDLNAGDASVANVNASGNVIVNNDFGRFDISSVTCNKIEVKANSGDVSLTDVDAAKSIEVKNDMGRVDVDGATADSLILDLNAGDLRADDIKAEDIDVINDFGKITFDRLVFTGRCIMESNAGDVELDLNMSEDDVGYELTADAGSVTVNGRGYGSSVVNRLAGAGAELRVKVDFGSIRVDFGR
jgi:DUF4097 and DUF4098 domain-containing protein YvlB